MASPAADEICAVVAVNSTDAVEIASLFPADNGTGVYCKQHNSFCKCSLFLLMMLMALVLLEIDPPHSCLKW